jgi:hypothetical protein
MPRKCRGRGEGSIFELDDGIWVFRDAKQVEGRRYVLGT